MYTDWKAHNIYRTHYNQKQKTSKRWLLRMLEINRIGSYKKVILHDQVSIFALLFGFVGVG